MARTVRSLAALVAMLLALALFAAQSARASDVDRLLDLLIKKGVITQQEAAALREEITKDEASEKARAIAEQQDQESQKKERPVVGTSPIRLSGWVQTRWTNAAGTPNSLELRRARIALDGNLTERLSYRLQVDAVKSPVLLDARMDFNSSRYAKVTIGQFKIPFSQENLISSRDLIPIERSRVVLSLVPGRDNGSNGRDIGAQLAGGFVRADGRPLFDYAVGLFNGAGINRRDDNSHKDAAARLVVYPFADFSLVGDYYNGASSPQALAKERAGVEWAYVRKLYSLRGEYIWGRDAAVHKRGWYSQFSYRLRPQWEPLFRFDNFDPNRQAASDATNTYLLGVNWYVVKWAKLQANYGVVDEQKRRELTHTFLTQVQFQF